MHQKFFKRQMDFKKMQKTPKKMEVHISNKLINHCTYPIFQVSQIA